MNHPHIETTMTAGASPFPDVEDGTELRTLLRQLSLEEKAALLTGASSWSTLAIPKIGLDSVVMSDGPAGVRDVVSGGTSTSMPPPSALAATWDEGAAREAGAFFAAEATSFGIDVVLAPVVNIQRTPVGGRHFENYSEDPWLTARMGAGFIRGLQENGVGACVKHFIANDSETERTSYVSRVGEEALREVYLPPFEAAVETGAWSVMAAYNGVDDGGQSAPMTEHSHLVCGVLKAELGFDGVVISDWAAASSTVATAQGGLDLVMPGPDGPWGPALVEAVRTGSVAEDVIDDKVLRLLRLARRVGKLGKQGVTVSVQRPDGPATSRALASRAMVVLKHGGRPHLDLATTSSVAVLGPNAADSYTQGGGSAHVATDHTVSVLDGLQQALTAAGISVSHASGGTSFEHPPLLDAALVSAPDGSAGLLLECLDGEGSVLTSESCARSDWRWMQDFGPECTSVRLRGTLALSQPGRHTLEIGAVGRYRVLIDGMPAAENVHDPGVNVVLDSTVNLPPGQSFSWDVENPRTVELDVVLDVIDADGYGRLVSAQLRHLAPGPSAEDEIAAACALAAAADAAVVVVGTNPEVESEGWDRKSLRLPGHQDALVRAVAAVNPHTFVVVNAGAPVLLPWRDDVETILWGWLGGQEFGHAVADVLTGHSEPAGRLPWTLPDEAAHVPVPGAIPVNSIVDYAEGVNVGYRGWQAAGRTPAYPIGHGLGWSNWRYSGLLLDGSGSACTLTVENKGSRCSTEVVQVYVEPSDGGRTRKLAGFTTAALEPGVPTRIHVELDPHAFMVWDAEWRACQGPMQVMVGRSALDVRLVASHLPNSR
ncbi:beta-glucosidase family protein [Specibacter sp. AOP5-B1-6]|uniref:beta-glucosidase family protein n=1 Tax=Specibacter sp. AOP5-B1-6 TaxID=3457653 RepID=UPI00402BC9FB